jgi:hypothetical protein
MKATKPKNTTRAQIGNTRSLRDGLIQLAQRAKVDGKVDLAEVLCAAESSLVDGDGWLSEAAATARPYLAKRNRGNRDSAKGRASSERDHLCRLLAQDLETRPTVQGVLNGERVTHEGFEAMAVLFLRRLRTRVRFCLETRVQLNGPLRAEDVNAVAKAIAKSGDSETRTRAALKAIGYAKWKNAFAHRDAATRRLTSGS